MKTFKKLIKNQKGMSLVEVVVAAAISVIISAAVMKTNQSGIKGAKTIEGNVSLNMWKANILVRELSNPTVCAYNFGGADLATQQHPDYLVDNKNDPAQPLVRDGETIPGTGGDWRMITSGGGKFSIVREAFVPDSTDSLRGRCDLKLTVQRTKGAFGASEKTIRIPMICTTAASGTTIQSCSTSASGTDTLWSTQLVDGANPEYIYRNTNVLIGDKGQTTFAPFQISLKDGVEFPAGSGNDVFPSMRITGAKGALTFDNNAMYEDADGCLTTVSDSTKSGTTPDTQTKFCRSNIILGASNVSATGEGAVGLGVNNLISGDRAFAAGTGNTASGSMSIAVGSSNTASGTNAFVGGSNSAALGVDSFVFGQDSTTHANASTALGWDIEQRAERGRAMGSHVTMTSASTFAFALGNNLEVDATWSMALGFGQSPVANQRTVQARQYNFLAMFDKGFDFKTDPNDQWNENKNVYIDEHGNMGIGKDIQYMPDSFFTSGLQPKLYVNGNMEVYGKLYVSGKEVGATPTWNSMSITHTKYTCEAGTLRCAYLKNSNGQVTIRGKLGPLGPGVCISGNSLIATLPADFRPPHDMRFIVDTGFRGKVEIYPGMTLGFSLIVKANGQIILNNSNCDTSKYISLDGISFYTY